MSVVLRTKQEVETFTRMARRGAGSPQETRGALPAGKRGRKYGAKPQIVAGIRYDSRAEVRYAELLELRRKAGEIVAWSRWQDRVTLIDGPTSLERVTYKPDFEVCIRGGIDTVIEAHDVKGYYRLPPDVRIKALLWRSRFPRVPLVFVDERGKVLDLFRRKPHRRTGP